MGDTTSWGGKYQAGRPYAQCDRFDRRKRLDELKTERMGLKVCPQCLYPPQNPPVSQQQSHSTARVSDRLKTSGTLTPMSFAPHTAIEPSSGPAGEAPLWALPFLCLLMFLQQMARDLGVIRQQRKRRIHRPDFRDFQDRLFLCEWDVRQTLVQGLRQLGETGALDLAAIAIPPPPDDWRPQAPRTAHALEQRMEIVARFLTDPEAYIRALASRMANAARQRKISPDIADSKDTQTLAPALGPATRRAADARPRAPP